MIFSTPVGISKISKDQAAKLPNKTHAIPGDEGYYIAELGVFHNLHCLVCLHIGFLQRSESVYGRTWYERRLTLDTIRTGIFHVLRTRVNM